MTSYACASPDSSRSTFDSGVFHRSHTDDTSKHRLSPYKAYSHKLQPN